jgi:hypothetical protein
MFFHLRNVVGVKKLRHIIIFSNNKFGIGGIITNVVVTFGTWVQVSSK